MEIDTLLVPTDGSDVSKTAARQAFDLAAQCDATVHLLAVADASVIASGSYPGDASRIRDRLKEQANAWVAELSADATARGLEHVTAVRAGVPAAAIRNYAREQGIDAIAMGTHGRGGVRRMILGSVTDAVVRTAPAPVVTIRPEVADES